MDNTETAFGAAEELRQQTNTQYAAGDFLRRFGAVISICLGLALLAHVVVTVVGQY